VCISTIAVGVVWMILSQKPVIEQKAEAPEKRTLAYQQAISEREEPKAETETAAAPASETLTEDAAGAPQDMAALPGEGAPSEAPAAEPLPWANDHPQQWGNEQGAQDETAYARPPADPYAPPAAGPYGQQRNNSYDRREGFGPPPEEPNRQQDAYGPPPGDPYAQPQDPYAQPQDRYARQQDPYAQPQDPYARQQDPNAQPQDPYTRQQDPNAQPQDPYAQQQDPYAQPRDPYAQQQVPYGGQPNAGQPVPYGQPQQGQWAGQPGEEWVQVIGSGTGMRSTASIDAPILFAFPYGRQLKVVSRNDDWVEVSDPSTSTKGWMPAHALAPSAGPNAYNYNQQAYEEQPQERRGLFRRGGFADMINRAFGGGN
jgi:Bacterial SH3 domain